VRDTRLGFAAAALAVCLALGTGATAAGEGARLPGARAVKVCAAAGPFWPTMTLALRGTSAWIACKEQARVIRIDSKTGKTLRSVSLRAPAIAVAAGLGSIWALDSAGSLYRLNPSTAVIVKRVRLGTVAAYNIWIGGGSVWVADDQGARVVRVSPAAGKVVARIPVGDGPADMAFSGAVAWAINHRDQTLTRIDLGTNQSRELTDLGGDAPERMVWLGGSLWVTGRGTDLLKVDPSSGSVERTIEIGASGIDVAAAGGTLWVPTRSAAVDQRGLPTMNALVRVSASTGAATTVARPTARLDVHGLVAAGGGVWIADNRGGTLYRIP
jgi:hypothetical protein